MKKWIQRTNNMIAIGFLMATAACSKAQPATNNEFQNQSGPNPTEGWPVELHPSLLHVDVQVCFGSGSQDGDGKCSPNEKPVADTITIGVECGGVQDFKAEQYAYEGRVNFPGIPIDSCQGFTEKDIQITPTHSEGPINNLRVCAGDAELISETKSWAVQTAQYNIEYSRHHCKYESDNSYGSERRNN